MLKYFYKLVWKCYKLESDAVWSEHWEYKINEKWSTKLSRVIWSTCFFKVSIEGLGIHDVSEVLQYVYALPHFLWYLCKNNLIISMLRSHLRVATIKHNMDHIWTYNAPCCPLPPETWGIAESTWDSIGRHPSLVRGSLSALFPACSCKYVTFLSKAQL